MARSSCSIACRPPSFTSLVSTFPLHRIPTNTVKTIFGDADSLLLQHFDDTFSTLSLTHFTETPIETSIETSIETPIETPLLSSDLIGSVSIYPQKRWVLFSHTRWFVCDQTTFQIAVLRDVSLPDYVASLSPSALH